MWVIGSNGSTGATHFQSWLAPGKLVNFGSDECADKAIPRKGEGFLVNFHIVFIKQNVGGTGHCDIFKALSAS